MVEQHNKILFLKQTTKKIRRFVKISCILISLFYVTKSLFFFSTPLSKNQCIDSLQWLISYQISLVVIARQPKYQRFYALISSLHDIDITSYILRIVLFFQVFPSVLGESPSGETITLPIQRIQVTFMLNMPNMPNVPNMPT